MAGLAKGTIPMGTDPPKLSNITGTPPQRSVPLMEEHTLQLYDYAKQPPPRASTIAPVQQEGEAEEDDLDEDQRALAARMAAV